jgi:hypothetical protein
MIVKKMGSRQKEVNAFLAVCDDETMLDQWIPSEPISLMIRMHLLFLHDMPVPL